MIVNWRLMQQARITRTGPIVPTGSIVAVARFMI
jgi:hypothetical protein